MQEIECFKIQTHYRKSWSEKWPQRKFFKAKHRKLISRSQKPRCAMERCTKCSHNHGKQQNPAHCSASAPPPKGAKSSDQSYAHRSWTAGKSFPKSNTSFNLKLILLFILRLKLFLTGLKIRLIQIGSLYTKHFNFKTVTWKAVIFSHIIFLD